MSNNNQNSFFGSIFRKSSTEPSDQPKNCTTKSQEHNGITWIDIHDPIKETLMNVAEQFNLQEIHIEQCLQKTQITQTVIADGYVFLLFYFPFFNKEENYIANSQVNVFLGKNFLRFFNKNKREFNSFEFMQMCIEFQAVIQINT